MPEDNKSYQPLVDQLGEIIKNGDETILRKSVSLFDLLPKRTTTFYRYFGSVTTPACQEIVIWTIFDKAIEISERQVKAFFFNILKIIDFYDGFLKVEQV